MSAAPEEYASDAAFQDLEELAGELEIFGFAIEKLEREIGSDAPSRMLARYVGRMQQALTSLQSDVVARHGIHLGIERQMSTRKRARKRRAA